MTRPGLCNNKGSHLELTLRNVPVPVPASSGDEDFV